MRIDNPYLVGKIFKKISILFSPANLGVILSGQETHMPSPVEPYIPGGNSLLFSLTLFRMMSKNSDLVFGYDLVKQHKQSRDCLEVNTTVRWVIEFL